MSCGGGIQFPTGVVPWNPTFRRGRETWGTLLIGEIRRCGIKINVKINVKSNGQECPFHTGRGSGRLILLDIRFIFANNICHGDHTQAARSV